MKQKNDFVKWLIPVIGILVIFESVVLVSNLTKTEAVKKVENKIVNTISNVGKKQETETVAMDMVLSSTDQVFSMGKTFSVNLKGTAKKDLALDALSLFVKYDPALVEISALTTGKMMPKATFSKISAKTGFVVVNYFITDQSGFAVKQGTTLDLAMFKVKAKKAGAVKFELGTGKDMPESVTMIVDNVTGKSMLITSNKLEIQVK